MTSTLYRKSQLNLNCHRKKEKFRSVEVELRIGCYAYRHRNGVWEQRLTIHYNCIGAIDIPDVLPLPYPEVSVNTRKGVVVTYVPNTLTA